jgi:hypothetical protein
MALSNLPQHFVNVPIAGRNILRITRMGSPDEYPLSGCGQGDWGKPGSSRGRKRPVARCRYTRKPTHWPRVGYLGEWMVEAGFYAAGLLG